MAVHRKGQAAAAECRPRAGHRRWRPGRARFDRDRRLSRRALCRPPVAVRRRDRPRADALRAELDRDRSADRSDPARAGRHPQPSRPRGPGNISGRIARSGSARRSKTSSRTARRGCRLFAPASTRCAAPSSARIFSAARRRPMPITSCSARSSGPARSASSSCWPPTIRCAPGAAACSICMAGWRAAAPPMAADMDGTAAIATVALIAACLGGGGLGRRHVFRAAGAAAGHGAARTGAAARSVVARAGAVFRLGVRRDRRCCWRAATALIFGVFGGFAGGGPARPCHAGHRHRHDAAVPAHLFRAVAALPSGRGAPRHAGGGAPARSDPLDRDGQSSARSPRLSPIGSSGRYWG